ncbi:hypothetical protein B566_EDAN012568 [Ephemera danica]|nr:hypothetical protein B566_EDAN012568 [Ephemera danica]
MLVVQTVACSGFSPQSLIAHSLLFLSQCWHESVEIPAQIPRLWPRSETELLHYLSRISSTIRRSLLSEVLEAEPPDCCRNFVFIYLLQIIQSCNFLSVKFKLLRNLILGFTTSDAFACIRRICFCKNYTFLYLISMDFN